MDSGPGFAAFMLNSFSVPQFLHLWCGVSFEGAPASSTSKTTMSRRSNRNNNSEWLLCAKRVWDSSPSCFILTAGTGEGGISMPILKVRKQRLAQLHTANKGHSWDRSHFGLISGPGLSTPLRHLSKILSLQWHPVVLSVGSVLWVLSGMVATVYMGLLGTWMLANVTEFLIFLNFNVLALIL